MHEPFPPDTRSQQERLRDFLFDSLMFIAVSALILSCIGCHQLEHNRESINRVCNAWPDELPR